MLTHHRRIADSVQLLPPSIHWSTLALPFSFCSASIFASQGVAASNSPLFPWREIQSWTLLFWTLYFLTGWWVFSCIFMRFCAFFPPPSLGGDSGCEGQSRPRCRSSYNNGSNWRCVRFLLRCAVSSRHSPPVCSEIRCRPGNYSVVSVEKRRKSQSGALLFLIPLVSKPSFSTGLQRLTAPKKKMNMLTFFYYLNGCK